MCDTEFMPPSADPKSVNVKVTTGTGMEIEWKDGHRSAYAFQWLRDACPCATCNETREKEGRQPGQPAPEKSGALPMFKPAMKPLKTEPVGRYAIRFAWNDGHETGIYSWDYLREHCPCAECRAVREQREPTIQ